MAKPKKPKPLLKKDVKFDPKKLLLSAKELVTLNFGNAATNFTVSVDLKEDSPEEKAWHLIFSALLRGLKSLVEDNYRLLETEPKNIETLRENVELSLEVTAENIGPALFKRPKDLKLLDQIRPSIIAWARTYSLTEQEATIFADRFKSYFAVALFETWADNPNKYEGLRVALNDNPYSEEQEREQAWERYHAQLEKALDAPVFDETFSLRSVYLPLRAAISLTEEEKEKFISEDEREPKYKVVQTDKSLSKWLNESATSIRVVSGGPGSGKSTLAKNFAVSASEQAYKTLYIPLHIMKFDRDLLSAVSDVLSKRFPLKNYNPLETDDVEKLLIIFDGLDELSLSSGQAEQSVTRFVEEVDREARALKNRNVKFLLLGRTLVVQDQQVRALNKAGMVLELLPYYIKESERHKYVETKVIKKDQRDQWWQCYAKIKSQSWKGLPEKLKLSDQHELTEITSQPLLNYLVAHRFSKDPDDFDPEQNLNKLYEGLIKEVFERPWGEGGSMHTRGIDEKMYFRLLEHVGICAWHGGDTRTARIRDIEEKLPSGNNRLKRAFETLGDSVEGGATRLLTAFYSQKAEETRDGDATFELTHKSFGEYLTARRIVSVFSKIHQQYTDEESELGPAQLLQEWLALCGITPVDHYLKRFIQREIELVDTKKIREWQETAAVLISHAIKYHMPAGQIGGLSYQEMFIQDRNAQEALLAFHSCCANIAKEPSSIDLAFNHDLRSWLAFLKSNETVLYESSLNHLNMAHGVLIGVNTLNANFQGYNLFSISFAGAAMIRANFSQTDMRNAGLYFANFHSSAFVEAKLSHANFRESLINQVSFLGADLCNADFRSAMLTNVDFAKSILTNVNFDGATLDYSSLTDAVDLLPGQLLNVASIYGTELDKEIERELRKLRPELFVKYDSDIDEEAA